MNSSAYCRFNFSSVVLDGDRALSWLQVFVDMKYKDGSHNTDEQIVGLLIALLFAGQHTSSITSTWTSLLITRCDIAL